jgi:L-aspartate semialdehyde sulfurtransferase ferredoxin
MTEIVINMTAAKSIAGRPVLYELSKRFQIVTNILAASITAESGFMALKASGDEERLREAIKWLLGIGMVVDAGNAESKVLLDAVKAEHAAPAKKESGRLSRPEGSVTCAIYTTSPKGIVAEPIVYELSTKFDIVTNIKGGAVTGDVGILSLELTGLPNVIDQACRWLTERGVTVERVAK